MSSHVPILEWTASYRNWPELKCDSAFRTSGVVGDEMTSHCAPYVVSYCRIRTLPGGGEW